MPEPLTTTAAATSSIIYRLLVYLLGPALATVVVMMMTPPQTRREMTAASISTMIFSLSFGAWLIIKIFGVNGILNETDAMLAGGVYFFAGLPGWFLVRAIFFTMEKERNHTIFQIVKNIREESKND